MANRYKVRRKAKPMSEINVVPYIDVMLVLLVIFMVTTPLLTQGVKVDLPKAQAKAIDAKQAEPLIVSVDSQGRYYLNLSNSPNAAMTPQSLLTQVAAEIALDKKTNKERPVLVKGDSNVDYGKVIQAMVLLQKAGAAKVGLLTQSPSEGAKK